MAPRFVNKSDLPARWLVLVLMSTLLFGSYYTYDNPAALHDQLADHLKLGKVRSSCREGRQPTRLTVLATASALATTAYPLVARSIVGV